MPKNVTVVVMPGVARPDLDDPLPWHQVLQDAARENITDVAVVLRSVAGEVITYSSLPNNDTTIGLLTRGIQSLTEEDISTEDSTEEQS